MTTTLEKVVIGGMIVFTSLFTTGTACVWTYLITKYDK